MEVVGGIILFSLAIMFGAMTLALIGQFIADHIVTILLIVGTPLTLYLLFAISQSTRRVTASAGAARTRASVPVRIPQERKHPALQRTGRGGYTGAKVSQAFQEILQERSNPKHCFIAMREWLEYVLAFLEEEHGLERLSSNGRGGPVSSASRIDRLRSDEIVNGNISHALHNVRRLGNAGAHTEIAHMRTPLNVTIGIENAEKVRSWLLLRYEVG